MHLSPRHPGCRTPYFHHHTLTPSDGAGVERKRRERDIDILLSNLLTRLHINLKNLGPFQSMFIQVCGSDDFA